MKILCTRQVNYLAAAKLCVKTVFFRIVYKFINNFIDMDRRTHIYIQCLRNKKMPWNSISYSFLIVCDSMAYFFNFDINSH